MPNSYSKRWLQLYTVSGDPLRQRLFYPCLFSTLGPVHNLRAIDFGCGDGTFIRELLNRGCPKIYGVERDLHFLAHLRTQFGTDARVTLIEADLTEGISNLPQNWFTTAFSIFVINELQRIDTFFAIANESLVPGGDLFMFMLHPWVAAVEYALQVATHVPSKKFVGLCPYSEAFRADYLLTLANEYTDYYHHRLDSVLNALRTSGFSVEVLHELSLPADTYGPGLTADPLRHPRYLFMRARKL